MLKGWIVKNVDNLVTVTKTEIIKLHVYIIFLRVFFRGSDVFGEQLHKFASVFYLFKKTIEY